MAKFLFWFSIVFIVYTYMLYPLILLVWWRVLPRAVTKKHFSIEPLVSVIVAAYNEEKRIGQRLRNLLEQEYSPKKLEIIVVSDGSMDRTAAVVKEFIRQQRANSASSLADTTIQLIEIGKNKGKPYALNTAVDAARGDYLIFTDARQKFEKNAVRELIANFSDPAVGSVSGELVFVDENEGSINAEMNAYWNLEKLIRKMESAIGSVPGATGAIYAVRKSLFRPLPADTLLDDVYVPMMVIYQGYRNVFDGSAVAYDRPSKDLKREKRRKVRTLLGNYQIFRHLPWLLVPGRNPIFLRYISHKTFRLFVPIFFITLMISGATIAGFFYKLVFLSCLAIITLTVLHKRIVGIPVLGNLSKYSRLFVSFNYFALLALFYLLIPAKRKVW